MPSTVQAAKLLGWASLAIGATEILATRWVQRTIGVRGHDGLIKAFGAREIASGAAILAQPGLNGALAAALWGRVAGDVVDVAALAVAGRETRNPDGLASVTGAVLAVTAMDVVVAAGVQRDLVRARRVSAEARARVVPTEALPNGATAGRRSTDDVASTAAAAAI